MFHGFVAVELAARKQHGMTFGDLNVQYIKKGMMQPLFQDESRQVSELVSIEYLNVPGIKPASHFKLPPLAL